MKLSQKNLDDNLKEKKNLIEKLKSLLIIDGSINEKYNEFKKIQNSWFKIGQVPRSQNVIIWNNFQHHIKNFYDYLHLNRKFKEIDLEHNLKEKEKIIFNAKKLTNINDQLKAFKDFERLKKRWKFELGPVKKEKEESLEEELKSIEEALNINRKEFELNKDTILITNYNLKESLIKKIELLNQTEAKSIKNWQEKIKTFESIKNVIDLAGPIPRKLKKTFWNNYKIVIREFYLSKNTFFKNIKKTYSDNLKKQDLLIEEIKIITTKDGEGKERQNVISIQKKWKLIKPVPYKANEKNWKIFKNICDIYFQKASQNRNLKHTKNKESEIKQDQLIEGLSEINGDSIELENVCKEYLSINKINSEKENLFFEKIKYLLIKEGFNEEESQIKINEMKSKFMSIDQKKSQVYKLNSNLDKLKKDLIQQENNLLFFNDKSKENKLLEAVHLKIKNQKLEIEKIINQKKDLLK
ncbi:DUF349 domain-containing protein [Flavobacteriaceae bacterium]|nr:DUF349 domain-containing protein [Flavobacteriaceae bacterium]MDB9994724.1 DUF349 domain-containing protein [Flavobacteriaceae bacterium]